MSRGEPYQGVPRRTQSCKTQGALNPIVMCRSASARWRDFGCGWIRSGSCRNFCKIAAAGTSAGGLRAAFSLFWVAPEAQRVGFRFLRKARRGAAPPPCQPFEKGWTENLFLLFLPTLRKNFLRVSTIVAAQPVARLMKLGARMMAASAWERRHAAQ